MERKAWEIMTATWHSLNCTPQTALQNPIGKKTKKSSQLSLVPWTPGIHGILYSVTSLTFGYQSSSRIEIVTYHVSALLFTLSEAVDKKELDCKNICCQQVLACFGELSLESDFIRPCYNRKTVTGWVVFVNKPNWCVLRGLAVFMTTSELQSMLILYFQSFLLCITELFSFSDIELLEDSGIPTEAFLASCYAVVPVLGKIARLALNSLVSGICFNEVIL